MPRKRDDYITPGASIVSGLNSITEELTKISALLPVIDGNEFLKCVQAELKAFGIEDADQDIILATVRENIGALTEFPDNQTMEGIISELQLAGIRRI